jgi:uncharacterized protein (DUF433 family)
MAHVQENAFLARITVNPEIFSGKPIVRGRWLAVEHVLGMLAAGESIDDLLREYPWLERDDIQACLVDASGTWVTSGPSPLLKARVSEGLVDTCMARHSQKPATKSSASIGPRTPASRQFWPTLRAQVRSF